LHSYVVRLSVSKISQNVFDEFRRVFGGVRRVTSNKRSDVGGDPDHDANPGIVKGIITFAE